MATLHIEGMDDTLYEALRDRAAMHNRSVSQEVMSILRDFLGRPALDPRHATEAVSELAGSWQDERTAEQIAADLRKARCTGQRE
jgi:plasmid stability protein